MVKNYLTKVVLLIEQAAALFRSQAVLSMLFLISPPFPQYPKYNRLF